MTSTHHPHPTAGHHEHPNYTDHHNHARLAAVLDLDAELMADYLEDAARLVAEASGGKHEIRQAAGSAPYGPGEGAAGR